MSDEKLPLIEGDWLTGSFEDVIKNPLARKYEFKIENYSVEKIYSILVSPGIGDIIGTTNNVLCDGLVPGTEGNIWVGSKSHMIIYHFLLWISKYPTSLIGMLIDTNNPRQKSQMMCYKEVSPFVPPKTKHVFYGNNQTTPIPLINFQDDDDKADEPLAVYLRSYNIALDGVNSFSIDIAPNSVTTFTLYFGPSVSPSHFLRTSYTRNINNLIAAGNQLQPFDTEEK